MITPENDIAEELGISKNDVLNALISHFDRIKIGIQHDVDTTFPIHHLGKIVPKKKAINTQSKIYEKRMSRFVIKTYKEDTHLPEKHFSNHWERLFDVFKIKMFEEEELYGKRVHELYVLDRDNKVIIDLETGLWMGYLELNFVIGTILSYPRNRVIKIDLYTSKVRFGKRYKLAIHHNKDVKSLVEVPNFTLNNKVINSAGEVWTVINR
ncbi:MAG: hypothetical protein ACPGDB_04405, partial [Fusobacterium sp.]